MGDLTKKTVTCILRFLIIIVWLFLAIFSPSFVYLKLSLSFYKGNLPDLRKVMIISDMMVKMRKKSHVWKSSQDCIGLIDIFPLHSGLSPIVPWTLLLKHYCPLITWVHEKSVSHFGSSSDKTNVALICALCCLVTQTPTVRIQCKIRS